jgi:predicted kinase
MRRQIVLVSGAPGVGKTTLAIPLAAQLGFSLLSKDEIKETLWDALEPPPGDRAWSRRVGGAAMEVLWKLAARIPQAVLEANFHPHSALEHARLTELDARIVEVYCHCSSQEAARRYEARAPERHPTHVLWEYSDRFLTEYDRPVGMGTVIDVDTEAPLDVELIASQVNRALGDQLLDGRSESEGG